MDRIFRALLTTQSMQLNIGVDLRMSLICLSHLRLSSGKLLPLLRSDESGWPSACNLISYTHLDASLPRDRDYGLAEMTNRNTGGSRYRVRSVETVSRGILAHCLSTFNSLRRCSASCAWCEHIRVTAIYQPRSDLQVLAWCNIEAWQSGSYLQKRILDKVNNWR